MPQIIPIKDLKNTAEISAMCHQSNDPVFITKNGYGDMVIMSMEAYEREFFLLNVQNKLRESEKAAKDGKVRDGWEALDELKKKYEV